MTIGRREKWFLDGPCRASDRSVADCGCSGPFEANPRGCKGLPVRVAALRRGEKQDGLGVTTTAMVPADIYPRRSVRFACLVGLAASAMPRNPTRDPITTPGTVRLGNLGCYLRGRARSSLKIMAAVAWRCQGRNNLPAMYQCAELQQAERVEGGEPARSHPIMALQLAATVRAGTQPERPCDRRVLPRPADSDARTPFCSEQTRRQSVESTVTDSTRQKATVCLLWAILNFDMPPAISTMGRSPVEEVRWGLPFGRSMFCWPRPPSTAEMGHPALSRWWVRVPPAPTVCSTQPNGRTSPRRSATPGQYPGWPRRANYQPYPGPEASCLRGPLAPGRGQLKGD